MKLKAKDYTWCYNKMKYWQKELGLTCYDVNIVLVDVEELGAKGTMNCSHEDMNATIAIASNHDFNSKNNVEKSIFHELCELMLEEVDEHLHLAGYSEDKRARLAHGVIRRLENLMFK